MKHSWIFPELNLMRGTIESMIRHAVEQAKDNRQWDSVADDLIDAKEKIGAALKVWEGVKCMKTVIGTIIVIIIAATVANAGTNGYATWYTRQSAIPNKITGITASGRLLKESALWCALPSRPQRDGSGQRAWGRKVRITNIHTGKSVVCEQHDVGPGRRARARGVCVDLTPAAFLGLGGVLKDGRLKVRIKIL